MKHHESKKEARKKSKGLEKVTKTKEASKPKTLKTTKESHSKPPIDGINTKDIKHQDTEVTKKHISIVKKISDHQKFVDGREDEETRDYHTSSTFEGDSIERVKNNRRGLPHAAFVRGGSKGNWRGSQRSTFDARGKREFDRQSGSDKPGIKSIDKRDGSGSHNWGNLRDDINNIQIPYSTEEICISKKNDEEPQAENIEIVKVKADGTSTNNVEEGEGNKQELTLDEWKALKMPKKTPTYNIRKAGEGEDLSQWKKMYALDKKIEIEGDEYEYEYGEFPQRVGRQKILEIDIRFTGARNIGGGRGRGFGRNGGFSSGQRSYSDCRNTTSNNPILVPAPKVDDERDFPSLA